MELEIYSPSQDGFIKAIEWNYEELKKEIAEKVQHCANLVYTDEQIKVAKADRAKLRKFVDALESKRKEIKKQCLAPYETFEKQMKEIVAVVNEPILMIDGQVKAYEESEREKKLEQILEIYNNSNFPDWATPDKVIDEKWLNASIKISAVEKELNAQLERITKDLSTLAQLPEFAFEATEIYKDTLDLNKAVEEGRRLSEMMKRAKAAEEAKAKAPVDAVAVDEVVVNNTPDTSEQVPETEINKQWVKFEALLSTEDALALKDFFTARGIEFRAVK